MKIKSKGMTLVEVMVSLAVLTIAFGAIYLLFSSSNRTLIDTEIKSQLQHEAQTIQERFSKLGMESTGIKTITPVDSSSVKELAIESAVSEKDGKQVVFTSIFTIEEKKLTLKTVTTPVDTAQTPTVEERILSENVKNFNVKSIDKLKPTDNIKDSESIKVEIELEKTKGRSTKSLEVNTIVTFRNYTP